MKSTDIVIIGAGPAGVTTSLFLSKAGIPHTLIEKERFPRDKICGDALSGKTVEVLKRLNPELLHQMSADTSRFIESHGVKFVAPNGKFLDIPFKSMSATVVDHAPGYISKRMHFDHFMFGLLNPEFATIYEETEVTSVTRFEGNIRIKARQGSKELEWTAKLVIGAEGDRSVVAKSFSTIRKENKHYCAGIRAYYTGVSDMHPSNFIELHFLDELLPGYFWIFPLPNGEANVGAGMLSSAVSRKKFNLKEGMLKAIQSNPNIRHRFKDARMMGKIEGWGLPLGSKKRPLSGDGYLLTGDAGSLIDPFTGEGIGNAMYSGMLAAETATAAIAAGRFDAVFLNRYTRAFYNRQWNELKLSHTLQKLSNYPWLFNFVVNKAERNSTLQETISCMFEDLDMRARLRNPMFYLKLLKNDR